MEQEIKQEFENMTKEVKSLTSIVQQGFKKHDEEIENLAIMTQRSFGEAKEETKAEFEKNNIRIDRLYTNVWCFFSSSQKNQRRTNYYST